MADGSQTFNNARVVLGVAWAQAGRDYMQDAFAVSLNIPARDSEIDFFGVFDGHGPNGENISRFIAYKLCDLVVEMYETNQSTTFEEAIETACLVLDERIRRADELTNADGIVTGGSTCCAVWIRQNELFSCNIGDSRFIMSYNGKAKAITLDHKPTDRPEKTRIEAAGGFVSEDDRVDGILGVARSFGDFMFKTNEDLEQWEQEVSVMPQVRTVLIDENIDFLVIASDGLYDMMQNQECVDFIVHRMQETVALNEICEQLIEHCIIPIDQNTGLGSDNMTIIIAVLR